MLKRKMIYKIFEFILFYLVIGLMAFGAWKFNNEEDVKTSSYNINQEEKCECYENCIAITFDDGPGEKTTIDLLEGLKERNVKATFFIIGENVENNKEIIKRMYDEGHLIGNHTFSHIQLTKVSTQKAKEEIIHTNEILKEVTGECPEYIRPPYGSYSKKLLDEISMTPVLWTVDPRDWNTHNVSQIVNNVVKNVKPGDIILLHDIYDSSVTAALEIIDELKQKGYVFVTVDQLLLD